MYNQSSACMKIGYWSLAVVEGMKKTYDHAEPTKVDSLKKQQQQTYNVFLTNFTPSISSVRLRQILKILHMNSNNFSVK